ncbi:hypothetical protein HDV05_001428, partial [Chytridiales sp. JEL 0842]
KEATFVKAATAFLLDRIGAVSKLVANGTIEVTLHHKPVDIRTAAEIHALNPYSMSWSNVCDYFKPAEFFKVARTASEGCETIHYLYSMNWVQDVKGTQIIDYGPPYRKQMIQYCEQTIYSVMFPLLNMQKYFRVPIATNVRNIVMSSMAVGMSGVWYDWFMGFAKLKNVGRQSMRTDAETFNDFSRSHTCLNITFTFDPEISFKAANPFF